MKNGKPNEEKLYKLYKNYLIRGNQLWIILSQGGLVRGRKRRLSLMQAAATSPKKLKLSEEELGKMEESINRQKQLDGEGDSDPAHFLGSYTCGHKLCGECWGG